MLKFDFRSRRAFVDDREIVLTYIEWKLLEVFLSDIDRCFSREELLERIHPRSNIATVRTVEVHASSLRRKLGRFAKSLVCLHGFGYRFEAPTEMQIVRVPC